MHRRLVLVFAAAIAGCAVRSEPTGQPPQDPPVEYPDADINVIDRDGGEPDDSGIEVPTFWADVYPIVFARCAYCHANEERDRLSGAPPIVTYAHTQAMSPIPGQRIYERMAFRVLNDNGTAGSMPQLGSPFAAGMTLEERRIIARWANGGAPEGTLPDGGVVFPDASPADGAPAPVLPWANGPVASDAGVAGVRYIDVYANRGDMRTAHRVREGRTNYNCFAFTIPAHPAGATEEFAFSFTPLLQLRRNIHHMEIYRQDPDNPIDPVGGNTPADWRFDSWWDCEGRTSQEQLVANYVPGQPIPVLLPRNVGYRLEPGDRLMLEIHYDGIPPGGADDMTGMRITTTATQTGIINAGEFWVGPFFDFNIAPTTNNTVDRRVVIQSECRITQPVNVFWIRPHMHERGLRQQFWIRRNGAAQRTVLADVNPWDPGNQPLFDVPPAEQAFRVGDVVGTSCEYRTMGRDVTWGAGGNDEMCFFNMIHYPYTFTQSDCWERACDGVTCPVTYPQ